jgi:hypothetical protein
MFHERNSPAIGVAPLNHPLKQLRQKQLKALAAETFVEVRSNKELKGISSQKWPSWYSQGASWSYLNFPTKIAMWIIMGSDDSVIITILSSTSDLAMGFFFTKEGLTN